LWVIFLKNPLKVGVLDGELLFQQLNKIMESLLVLHWFPLIWGKKFPPLTMEWFNLHFEPHALEWHFESHASQCHFKHY
jgi:hypothetical protein